MTPIPGHSGYAVTTDGRVFSLERRVPARGGLRTYPTRELVQYRNRRGYLRVALYRESKGRNWFIHELVLLTFVGPRPDGFVCRHLDGDPANNNVANLAWGTHEENAADKVRHGRVGRNGLKGERIHTAKLTSDQVRAIRSEFAPGMSEVLGSKYGVSGRQILSIVRGQSWSHLENM
jgi:hypothetical protein